MTPVKLFPPYLNAVSNDGVNSSGAAVTVLQVILLTLGKRVLGHAIDGLVADGDYGPATIKAVKGLQVELGFNGDMIDGNFGPGTRTRLNAQFGIDVDVLMADPFAKRTHWVDSEGILHTELVAA